jgi:hypothetical protein
MRPVTLRPRPVQRPVTSVTSVRLRFLAFGAVENRRFISQKSAECVLASPSDHDQVIMTKKAQRNPNPSLLLKLNRLRKRANITK